MTLGPEEQAAFREMAASFAARSIRPILDHESPDGEVSRVGAIMEEAFNTGLLSSARTDAPGHETGVWGKNLAEHGPRVSLMLLEELAAACGGVAMNVHVLGLGGMVLGMAVNRPSNPPARVAVALCEGGFPPGPDTIDDPSRTAPARVETEAAAQGDGFVITGKKEFVYQGEGTEAFLVFARMEREWAVFLVPKDTEGLTVEETGPRMGLRACPLVDLDLKSVRVDKSTRLEFSIPLPEVVMEYLRLWWLGNVAIGAGVARSALAAAREYALERYQGCTEIINHPGMGSLLADSESRILVCQGLLDRAGAEGLKGRKALLLAAEAKLRGSLDAAAAVTDSLQVFGGYGYMEDYRMEKRFRDINTLKCAGGGPRDLRMIISELNREV